MKTLLLLLISFSAFAQDKVYRVHTDSEDSLILLRYSQSKTINVTEGLVYKWVIPAVDTARFFNATDGQYEATVTFRKLGTTDPDTTTVTTKVDAEQMTFSSDWQRHGPTVNNLWYNKTIAYSNDPASSAKYSFNGKRIEVWGEKNEGQGTGVIIIDSVSHDVSWKVGPYGLPVMVFAKDLPEGNHTIEIKPKVGNVLIDYLVIAK
jgi:hypothetical protein